MSDRNALVARLEKLDACAVSDALDSLQMSGAESGIPRRSTQQRIAGVVQTVKLHDEPPAGGSKRHLGTAAIESADNHTIIVVEQRTGIDCAGWGGVLANAAKVKGVRGVIMEGPARDIDEYEEIGFPVFSRFTTPHTARGRVYEQSFGEPIQVGEARVAAGDYVIADASGIVFIPAARAEEVISIAEKIAEKERLMTADVLAGKPVSEVMGTNYENMLENK
ncbi:RraA family protein [Gammaproteobacteria bacterium]|jgi:4-hydroxy-4-methyl-2-oxoglutarate aldolase|nr:RraA family protein [Gammaproteobacteria bacterium]